MYVPKIPGFEILEALPRGGMSTVYKARQISLDRLVALKTLPPDLSSHTADINQFLFEARVTAKLKHPNIVQVYDCGESDGVYYFVMEFISGYSVGSWLKRKKILSEDDALLIATSVATALDYAWEKAGVVHCDIKPDNVMIDGDGTVKVADLGLAKSVRMVLDSSKTSNLGVVFGTPNYISPEQSRGDTNLDCRADIYSLGAMLYHMVTGKLPFEEYPSLEAMDKQIKDFIADPQDINPSVTTENACLIEKMMAKERAHRQPNWHVVLSDIARVRSERLPEGALLPSGNSTVKRSPLRDKRVKDILHLVEKPISVRQDGLPEGRLFQGYWLSGSKQHLASHKPKIRFQWVVGGIAAGIFAVLGLLIISITAFKHLRPDDSADARPETTLPTQSVTPRKTADIPGATNVPSSTDEAAVKEKNAKDMYDFACQWAVEHPDNCNEAIDHFKKIETAAEGTKYALMASAEITKLNDARKKGIQNALTALNQKAEKLVGENKLADAAAQYEQYNGPWANETAADRSSRAKVLRDKIKAQDEALKKELEQVNQKMAELLASIASELLNGNLAAACSLADESVKNEVLLTRKADIEGLQKILAESAGMDKKIIDSFIPQIGQEITIGLLKGSDKYTVREVTNDVVKIEKIVKVVVQGQISQELSVRPADLSAAEKKQRLGAESSPGSALMLGLISFQDSDFPSAEILLAKTGPLLSPALLVKLNELRQTQLEDKAKQALVRLLKAIKIDVKEGSDDLAQWLTAVNSRKFNAKEAQILAKEIELYRKKFGITEFAKQADPLLQALSRSGIETPVVPSNVTPTDNTATGSPPTSPESTDPAAATTAKLMELNPGLREKQVRIQGDDKGVITRISVISPELKDISPIAQLTELQEAICSAVNPEGWRTSASRAPLKDLAPLKKLHALKVLDIRATEVKDLSSLKGLPLVRLNAAQTQIDDISPLAGMALEQLSLDDTAVKDVSVIAGMPIRYLSLAGVSFKDLSLLKGMPLKNLDISNTGVKDLAPLAGMALEFLDCSKTDIKSLLPLKGMPIRTLHIDMTEIKDLTPLTGMSLESFHCMRTSVRDLSPLKGMPLKRLNIMGTDLKDLRQIEDFPIEFLWIDDASRYEDILGNISTLKEVNGDKIGSKRRNR